jgi:hypothetical protein
MDIMFHHHGTEPEIATQTSGSKCINYIFTSPRLQEHVTRCEYLPFYAGIHASHHGAFIDLEESLFGGITKLGMIPVRNIRSTNQADVYEYKTYIHKQFTDHWIYK